MKILLDECVPSQLEELLSGHECVTVQGRGWTGIKNGELLRLATVEFDLFLTADQGIRYQQNMEEIHIGILQLSTNDLRRIRAAAALIQEAVAEVREYGFQPLLIP